MVGRPDYALRCIATSPCRSARDPIEQPSVAETATVDTVGTWQSTVEQEEIEKFDKYGATWWDPFGPTRMLHEMNPMRVEYLTHLLAENEGTKAQSVWQGKKVMDIGCGGGLLSEALARLGANVTGIDASERNVYVATSHAAASTSLPKNNHPTYHHTTSEAYLASHPSATFDVVLALEVLEHVANPQLFLTTAMALLRPGGLIVLSTLNRGAWSWFLTIALAERVLGWVPRGTHVFEKYIRPSEARQLMMRAAAHPAQDQGKRMNDDEQEKQRYGLIVGEARPIYYEPWWGTWKVDLNGIASDETTVNYFLHAWKKA